jgi:hypothetical protein
MNEKSLMRFWSNIPQNSMDECWPWLGSASVRGGYGEIHVEGKARKAHRVMYSLIEPEFDTTLHILHRCDNPPCVNPSHLFAGTNLDNVRDAVAKGRNKATFKINPPRGEANVTAVLTCEQVLEARRMIASGYTYKHVGQCFNVGATTIHYAVKTGWKHLK